MKRSILSLGAAFLAGSLSHFAGHANAGNEEQRSLCVDNLLIPSTAAEADFLDRNAGTAYEALEKTQDPLNSPFVAATVREYLAEGKTVTFTGLDMKGAKSTLPDGTTRPVACYTLTVK